MKPKKIKQTSQDIHLAEIILFRFQLQGALGKHAESVADLQQLNHRLGDLIAKHSNRDSL